MDINKLPKVKDSREFIAFCRAAEMARRPVCFLGPPGIGKTAIVGSYATSIGKACVFFDVGNSAREDAIIPVVTPDGRVMLTPQQALKVACERGVVLFLDEMGHTTRSQQAMCMAITNERRVGDMSLHPDTVVVLAGNDVESGGLHSLMFPLVNRCCLVYYTGDRADSLAHLATIGSDDPNATAFERMLRDLALDYTATAERRTELLVLSVPGVAEDPEPVPTPRGVEGGLRMLGAHLSTGNPADETAFKMLAGCIGQQAAAAYFAVRKLRDKLPTPDEVCKNPDTCVVPPDIEAGIAVLGIVKMAAAKDANAAWVYTARLKDKEIRAASTRGMLGKVPTKPAALAAFNKLVGEAGHVLKRTT